jgi:transcriptional regulator with XRE-family HTH domain
MGGGGSLRAGDRGHGPWQTPTLPVSRRYKSRISDGAHTRQGDDLFVPLNAHHNTATVRFSWVAQMPVHRAHAIDKHVGGRVRMRRLMLNMSQSQIAKALGLTFQQIQKYEKGANRISASRLQHMCSILQVPMSFFFDDAPQARGLPDLPEKADGEAAALDSFIATSDGVALALAFGRIRDAKVRRAIVALVEQIVAEPAAELKRMVN